MLRLLISLLMTCAIMVPRTAWAWGKDGHTIVARVAENFLTSNTKKAISGILSISSTPAGRGISDQPIPVWADEIKRSAVYARKYPNNGSWHFVDVPLDRKSVV